ncbi:MAG: hypothetical protein AMJ72_12970 [Acidithiobacillales bacterium SM1_46]|nr:MAG: hypothetical protein AMJ72_12970 [Acidithiobacillales bacterium SM1_46]
MTGAAAASTLLAGSAHAWPAKRQPPQQLEPRRPRRAKVALVFAHIPSGSPTWPTKDYDYDARRKELTEKLEAACPGTDFTVATAHNGGEAVGVIRDNPDVDGFMVYLIGIWTGVPARIMRSGKPTVVVDDLYAGSGEILALPRAIREKNLRAALIGSSDFDDVVRGVKWLEVIAAMKGAKIINVKDRDISEQTKTLRDVLGIEMVQMKSDELRRRYEAADEALANEWADYWIKAAASINKKETSREEVVKGGKIHVAFCKAFEEMEADTVTMDCLGMFYGNKINAYPCLSFFELLNQGLTGVCESDVDSTATFLLMRYLTGRPGFVSDPVIDTSTGEIIYAHCVGTNRVFGPKGKANKYVIRSHAEDEKGAAVQSLMPRNEPITSLKVHLGSRHLVVHTGTTTRNVDEPKACRTKLAAKAEVEQLLRNWTYGWHRVTVFGKWREDVLNLAQLLGLTAVEEDKPMA